MHGDRLPMNFYELLGVPPTATLEEIKSAYRVRIAHYHPDRNSSPHAAAVAALLNEAWETLSDSNRRCEHDRTLAACNHGVLKSSRPDSDPVQREHPNKAVPHQCALCGQVFESMTDAQWQCALKNHLALSPRHRAERERQQPEDLNKVTQSRPKEQPRSDSKPAVPRVVYLERQVPAPQPLAGRVYSAFARLVGGYLALLIIVGVVGLAGELLKMILPPVVKAALTAADALGPESSKQNSMGSSAPPVAAPASITASRDATDARERDNCLEWVHAYLRAGSPDLPSNDLVALTVCDNPQSALRTCLRENPGLGIGPCLNTGAAYGSDTPAYRINPQ